MNQLQSDALVFFGATGDLAYKKVFPALQEMIKRGTLAVPVIGVAKSGWNLPQLQARARDSTSASALSRDSSGAVRNRRRTAGELRRRVCGHARHSGEALRP
jgi:glucose-6-phosphate 1-dehydrogenase